MTTLIPGIPVLGIYIRYNLLSGKVCGPVQSAFWGVVAPWIVTLFLYEQQALVSMQDALPHIYFSRSCSNEKKPCSSTQVSVMFEAVILHFVCGKGTDLL